MYTLTKEPRSQDTRSALAGQSWDIFLPATPDSDDMLGVNETRKALQQAEITILAQEERIRALEALALCDEMTGLSNRRGFNAAFDRELALARRDSNYGGVLVMVDLDGFKLINDTWGHQAGDAYLCAVAQALQDCVRSSDVVARLGGDEFAVLLTHMDEKSGAKRLAKLEQTFNNRSMTWNGKRLTLRASFGNAIYSGSDTAEAVMQSADIRLYAHKARHPSHSLQRERLGIPC
jgi:diguanylate cyclase (GGDEF)-like protein